jgi:hypothetical protein
VADKTPRKPQQPRRAAKKAWEPPRVKTGHLFESNSLACGKNGPFMEECMSNPTLS